MNPNRPEMRLVNWLYAVATTEPLRMSQLRQSMTSDPTPFHQRAALFAEVAEHGEVYAGVAHLLAVYHRTNIPPSRATWYGKGSMGTALRRVDPPRADRTRESVHGGSARLALDRIVSGRHRIRWRSLEQAVHTLRTAGAQPPSWAQLTADLTRWHDRSADIPQAWVEDYVFLGERT